jgi:lactate dehydrogenase-like 2-hydroxyacid dehydrogenase
MTTIHFNVDENIKKYLRGIIYSFSLSAKTLSMIPNKTEIKAISIKSQSAIDERVLESLPNLKLIVTRTVGTDHIDLEEAKKRKIEVKNIPDYGASNIAEHAMALLLTSARNIVQADADVHQGRFDYEPFMGMALKGKTLGVIGTGKTGLELVKIAKAIAMNIKAFDVFKNERAAKELGFPYVSLDELLETSDFISLHVPLLPTTKHLIGEKEIKKMKPGVILVNTSRGGIINTKALVKNIRKFKAVALDVLEDEKNFTKKDPLLKYKNVIITPHIAFFTDESVKKIAEETEKIIKEFN